MPDIINKLPPQNIEAEASVLGAILLDKDALVKIADFLQPDDFYKDTHAIIFQTMLDLYSKLSPIDTLSVGNRLMEINQLEAIGGRTYLSELANIVPTSSHVASYAEIVQRKSTLRRLMKAADEIMRLSFQEQDEIDELLDNAEQKLYSVSQRHLQQNFIPIKNILHEAFDRIDAIHQEGGMLRGVSSGFNSLDNLLAGFQPSDLVILAARPSVGKTSLALDIARQAAIKHSAKVGIFSLEMSKEQLVDRLLCAEANVDLWKMRTGRLGNDPNSDEFPRLGHAMGILAEASIFIDDSATANVMELRTKARRLKTEHGLDMIIVDYLQLMRGRSTHGDNRVQEVSEITRELKGIARELSVPVLALSQLSRLVESRSPAIPRLADLRESGSIEQDADVVMFIYRKWMDKSQGCGDDERHLAEIHVAKHRNGPTGSVQLFFDEERASFKNLEKTVHDPFAPAK
ncbi:MAG: replicative DNA helicase [bacterium]